MQLALNRGIDVGDACLPVVIEARRQKMLFKRDLLASGHDGLSPAQRAGV
jgi:hypothetical protein